MDSRVFLLLCAVPCLTAQSDIAVLSSRPDMVSGGTVLLDVAAGPEGLRVRLNGRDVTARFRPARIGGRPTALLDGLKAGRNVVEVRSKKRRGQLVIVSHDPNQPVFSGPKQSPFVCQTVAAGLGEPLDADCTAKTNVAWFYRTTAPPPAPAPASRPSKATDPPPGFKPFDPAAPRPADIARTTTTGGETVDFIVRREVGTINRAVYQIAFLHDPRTPLPDAWTNTPGWNGRLVYSFGGGCHAGYRQGLISGAVDAASLAKGFATASASLNVLGNNCNDVISAETLMRVKEHFVKSFGPPLYTIGTGGSGGSIQQHLIAQNYPGLLDGIIPGASYPDIATVVAPVVDCALLGRVTEGWTEAQRTAVSGYATWGTCQSWLKSYAPVWLQPDACDSSMPKARVYDKTANPKGTRCTLHDNQVNIYGRDPATGFARRPYDNIGVQYGLVAFNAGTITAGQFVSLNERAGGFDADGELVDARTAADPEALRIAYRTGRVDAAAGSLPDIPILDVRQYMDLTGNIHDRVRSFSMRARLERVHGTSANQVMLVNPRGLQPVLVMDQWLAGIARDREPGTPAAKVVRNKPAGLTDACWTGSGERVEGTCQDVYPPHADPRLAAGAPLANDILKCALKPLDPKDYRQSLSAEQVARLKAVFPQGVCDYTRPGIAQELKPQPWLRF